MTHPTISILVPVYNSEQSLLILADRLEKVFAQEQTSYEIVFVNDNSKDESFFVLKEIKKKYPNCTTIIDLQRNFGQQNALMCGFQYCRGNVIITIDDDLQNPPEEIPKLLQKLAEGYDAVFGTYEKKKDKIYKNLGSFFIRKLNQKIFNIRGNLKFSSCIAIKR